MAGNLRIGTTVDVAELKSGLATTVEAVKEAADRIPIAFDEAAGRTKAALDRIGDDVKQQAEVVTIEAARVAAATKAQAAAYADLRNATIVARDAKLDDASSTALLAAAQQKAAEAAATLAAAKKAEAESVAAAAEEEALSQNVIIRAFQRAAIAVGESTAEIREQMVATAEAGGLEAEGITSGFAGFSKLLGAGIAVGFAASYVDGLAKMNVELDHLSVESGVSVQSLAGLQQIVKEMGGEWEPVSIGLIRFNRAMAQAEAGAPKYKTALDELGLSLEDLKGKTPEEQLNTLAEAFQRTGDRTKVADAAITLFGRGGIALVPVLKEQGANLAENVRRTGELTGVTEESAAAARRWTQDTARLSAQFRSVMIPVMEHAEDVLRGIWGVSEIAAAALLTVFETAATGAVTALVPVYKLAQALWDLVHGNFAKALDDARSTSTAMANTWKAGFADIKSYWQEVAHTFTDTTPVPKLIEPAAEDDSSAGVGTDHGTKGRTRAAKREREAKSKPLTPADYADPLSTDTKALNASFASDMQEEVKLTQEGLKQQIEAYREADDEKIRMAQEGYKATEQELNGEVQLGRMTVQQKLNLLQQAAQQEYQIELAAIQAKEQLDMNDVQKYQQDLNRQVQITRQYNQQLAQLAQQAAQQTQKVWQTAYERMTSQFNSAVASWVVTGRGFGQSMNQMMQGMTETFTRNVMKMAEQYLLGLLLQKTGQKSQIMADAKTAAANTYAAVSAIPVVGPFLAPPAAAAAFAGVMAFDSFAAGGVVQGAGGAAVPILAHAGERVLSTSQTQNFETLVNSRADSRVSNSTINLGGLEQHFHGSRSTPRDAARGMQDAIRRGRLRFA